MEQIHRLVLLIPIFSIFFAQPINASHDYPSMKLDLIHRHALEGAPLSRAERIRDLLRNDFARQNTMAQKRRRALEGAPSAELAMFPGTDFGNAQYFVNFRVGSPFQKFALVVDTGSDLTWMHCRYGCGQNCTDVDGRVSRRRVFIGDRSFSFRPVPCSSQMCKEELVELAGLDTCPTPTTPCAYKYGYMDGSTASGFFVNETVSVVLTNREKFRLENVLIGCSLSSEGSSFNYADGVLGLAYQQHSFVTRTIAKFGGKFSYCLVDHMFHRNATNYLVFGSNRSKASPLTRNMRYTKLELNLIPPFYSVNVKGISLNGKFLDIPSEAWEANKKGGMIIDSGMSLTFLATPAYGPVMTALEQAVAKYPKVKFDVPMKHCFNSTGFDKKSIPKLMFHFTDNARFEPHSKSYIIDVDPEVSCLGFMESDWPGYSSIGNIMQQNHLWEFDLVGGKLSFSPSICRD